MELRAKLRRVAQSQRERWCGRICVEHAGGLPEVVIKRRDGQAHAHFSGLLKCGRIWTCPVCSLSKRGRRAELIAAAMRGVGGRWQLLTLTVRHREGMLLAPLLRGLATAWRKTRQGGAMQRLWSEHVTMSVRATEVTHGENGWHPHLHVLIRTSEWSDEDRATLLRRFQEEVREALGQECNPSDARAVLWSAPFDVSDESKREMYIFKLGGEVAGAGKHAGHGQVTHWQLAERAADGDQRAYRLWEEFVTATKGRRMLELDDRAKHAAERQLEKEGSLLPEPDEVNPTTVRIELQRDDIRALRRLEWRHRGIFGWLLQAAEREGAAGVREWVDYARCPPPRSVSSVPSTGPPPWMPETSASP